MKREISRTALPGRTVDLWTPWGILRLTDPDDAARPERKPGSRLWMRPAGERPVHERPAREPDVETRP